MIGSYISSLAKLEVLTDQYHLVVRIRDRRRMYRMQCRVSGMAPNVLAIEQSHLTSW